MSRSVSVNEILQTIWSGAIFVSTVPETDIVRRGLSSWAEATVPNTISIAKVIVVLRLISFSFLLVSFADINRAACVASGQMQGAE